MRVRTPDRRLRVAALLSGLPATGAAPAPTGRRHPAPPRLTAWTAARAASPTGATPEVVTVHEERTGRQAVAGGGRVRPSLTGAGRQETDHRIRTSGARDAVIDVDAAPRDPVRTDRLLARHGSGDHLRPDDAGTAAMAAAVPPRLFH